MEPNEYLESGILELYVYGLLSDDENLEVSKMAREHTVIDQEIVSIEKSILQLSSSFSPFLSPENFDKIKERLELKHGKVVEMKPKSNVFLYMGWAASLLLLLAAGYSYFNWQKADEQLIVTGNEKNKLMETVTDLEIKNKSNSTALGVIRDTKNTVVALGGQAVSPASSAKVYWNKETNTVYVDASGLPEPPAGKVYQVWALKLNPLTPTSIGLLDGFASNDTRIFAVDGANGAEAFGITLEPAGGSKSPTLEQLYTLGKV
ncbi:MAG: anti-sigma factor [Flavobacterium sp.]|uniref:anti-sigma factor n=1 Tax=Flavobacterium sp. TaxID=239 RepID=UPI0011F5475C|nr:anti-sigma factor [Flavobacterium sp.]RZJ68297.1 MAG: anti-sigma factor [Flavobacterium sp.]